MSSVLFGFARRSSSSINNIIGKRFKATTVRREIVTSDFCKPVAPYAAATKGNGFVFLSGQLGVIDGKLVGDDIISQTERVCQYTIIYTYKYGIFFLFHSN